MDAYGHTGGAQDLQQTYKEVFYRLKRVKVYKIEMRIFSSHLRSAKFGARHKKRAEIISLACPKKVKTKKKVYRTPWSELLKYVF